MMEEDAGVTVIVTRLRRRLSVEQSEEAGSPSTPSKKRVGRLAAKPQLDLIDENVQVSSPRKTRKKSLAKDVADEEKPVTPSRRSTRIKSNTSIVSETLSVQATDSPRAKRALRRNSAAGSDNEGPATPARQTRRTRKDSASSVENQEPAALNRPKVVEMVIVEEPENDVQKSETETVVKKSKSSPSNAVEELSPNSARKSKRLLEKRKRRSGSNISDHDNSVTAIENKSLNISAKDEVTKSKKEIKSPKRLNKSTESNELSERLSDSNLYLLKALDTESKVKKSNHNKSVSTLESEQNEKKKRIRTESWPALLTVSPTKDNIVFTSDNEQAKKKKKKSANIQSFLNESSSGLNRSVNKEDDTNTKNEKDTSPSPSKRKKKLSETSLTKDVNQPSKNMEPTVVLTSAGNSSSRKENPFKMPENNDIASDMEMLFQNPRGNVQAIVYFEDSDSNSVNTETAKKIQQLDSEDQCVPVIKNDIEYQDKASSELSKSSLNSKEIFFSSQTVSDREPGHDIRNATKANDDVDNSCEPMDIDETIPEEILQKSQNTLQESASERKSLTLPQGSSIMEETNNSKRKSSISGRDTPDRSSNENKSTLILSQVKDVSATSETTQSPKPVRNELSNSNTVNDNDKVSKSNVSSNDLKETPLRPKNVTNLTMQTSTPITTPKLENKTKVEQKNSSPEKNHSNLSKSIDESQSSDEDTDEPSENKRNLLDDEAEEASDDYESGDSRDEEEKQYEEEHEIVERGETLDSDESDGDVSNDSDYEKDSFVVSSDAEDNDLLSGSGDDLSSGDNELSMSEKSKKKYNERKSKEQKAASREMFESRHKLNTSKQKSPAPKTKNNRMRIDSSLLDSDEEVVVKPKKNNRLRLDSTLDTSEKREETNESLNKSKKKSNKALQESIYNESAYNEKEITLCDENISIADPLQVHFKQEPKTPQKDLNISVVQFTDRKDIENVEVAESISMLNQTETDPLQATIVAGDTSDSSESEEILQNYDLVLNELNKNKKAKLSNNNVSLKMDKKGKKKNATIIDQLNLTNTKTPNKDKKAQSVDVVDSKTIESSKKPQDSDIESSSSIDLQLLFTEDNCGSGDEGTTKNEQQNKDEQMFVPLKKSLAKTNICESEDTNMSQQELILTESSKKKKKRKSSVAINETEAEPEDPNQFEKDKKALNTSLKKKNRKSSLVPSESVEEPLDAFKSQSETPLNDSSKKEKKRKSSIRATESAEKSHDANQGNENESVLNKSSKKKKKQRASLSATELEAESRDVNESMEALLNESSSKKKKNTNTSAVEESQDDNERVVSESMKKKKIRKSSLGTVEVADSEGDLFFIDTTGAQVSETDDNAALDKPPVQVLYTNEKKKKSKIDRSQNIVETNDHIVEESNMKLTPKTQKKNKSHDLESSVFCDDDSDGAPEEVLFRSEKASNQENELHNTESLTKSEETDGGKKKKKKKKLSAASDQSVENFTIEEGSSVQNLKKRKRKSSDTVGEQGSVAQAAQEADEYRTQDESLSVGSHKKKRKISSNTEVTDQTSAEADNVVGNERKSKKKKHKNNLELNFQTTAPEPEVSHVQVKKNKKRKERDEDIDSKKTKVSKENSFQEVHKIPLLPASIISQLEDKPRKVSEKPKVISTSKFIVETARQKRAKPSNYLEESIYLNDDSPLVKQEKSRIKKPKVLPFIPTASISGSGYTTNFKINKVSQAVQFAAEPAGITFSKEKYLQKKEIKRLGTYDLYKKQIHKKLSKF